MVDFSLWPHRGLTAGVNSDLSHLSIASGSGRASVMVDDAYCKTQCINSAFLIPDYMERPVCSPLLWFIHECAGLRHLSVSHRLSVLYLEAPSGRAFTYPYFICYLFSKIIN